MFMLIGKAKDRLEMAMNSEKKIEKTRFLSEVKICTQCVSESI